MQALNFRVGQVKCSLPLSQVVSVEFSAELSPLPHAPEIVEGILNYHGKVIPVINVGKRFGLEDRELSLQDRFILCQIKKQSYLLWVEEILGTVEEVNFEEDSSQDSLLRSLPFVRGITQLDGELLFIHDLEKFLSLEESRQIEDAMQELASEP